MCVLRGRWVVALSDSTSQHHQDDNVYLEIIIPGMQGDYVTYRISTLGEGDNI